MKDYLNEQNLTHLAKDTGISRSTLSLMRSGKQTPTYPVVVKLIQHLQKIGYNDSEILSIILNK